MTALSMLDDISENTIVASPIGIQSANIYHLREHALLGISPFNSYFTETRLMKLFAWSLNSFRQVTIFLPDTLSAFTLKAMGYDPERAAYKTRRQDSYLKNKVLRALDNIGCNKQQAKDLIMPFSDLSKTKSYQDILETCLFNFDNDQDFRAGCLSTSSWILGNNPKTKNLGENVIHTAVQYFLKEFPLFIDTPKILNLNTSVFIYHHIPEYLEFLYLNHKLVAPNQGFLKVSINEATSSCKESAALIVN